MTASASKRVEERTLDLNTVAPRDREEVWRATAVGSFEASGLPSDLVATARGYQLGPVRFADSTHPEQTLVRTAARARADGVDAFMCSLELTAGFGAVVGDVELAVGTGQVTFWDLSRPVSKIARGGRTLCLTIERDALEKTLPSVHGLHGLTLGTMGTLAADHLRNLSRELSALPSDSALGLGRATTELLAACVRPSLERVEQSGRVIPDLLRHRVDHFIRQKLQDPDLSPEQIARGVGLSRASLYRLFEAEGGVANHIRDERLQVAYRLMLRSDEIRRVGEIGFELGFKTEAHFSRAFRAKYGASPSEVRSNRALRLVN